MKKIEPTIEAILGKLDSLCDNCGACCKEVPNITLSKFEAPIIAYHLRELGGKSLVRKHLLYRPNPYNIFSDYVFVVDTGCPFHLDSKCIIYKDRPTVCKLFPIFIDAFIDNDDPNLMKIPFASFHSTHHVTCKDKIDSMNELSKQYGEEMRLRIMTAVLWKFPLSNLENCSHRPKLHQIRCDVGNESNIMLKKPFDSIFIYLNLSINNLFYFDIPVFYFG